MVHQEDAVRAQQVSEQEAGGFDFLGRVLISLLWFLATVLTGEPRGQRDLG